MCSITKANPTYINGHIGRDKIMDPSISNLTKWTANLKDHKNIIQDGK